MMTVVVKRLLLASLFVFLIGSDGLAKDTCKAVYGQTDKVFTLATGSPGELGLLEELARAFNATHGTSMCWRKAGSGKSLALLKNKDVDIVMVHAPAAEKKAVEDGWAIKRSLIGSNEFYIVGPKDDPAGIAKATSAADAYKMIAAKKAPFLSRGDNSGTNKKELRIWKSAGVVPEGDWYVITKDFMMATLKKADEIGGYFMTDSSTWVAGQKDLSGLATPIMVCANPREPLRDRKLPSNLLISSDLKQGRRLYVPMVNRPTVHRCTMMQSMPGSMTINGAIEEVEAHIGSSRCGTSNDITLIFAGPVRLLW